MTRKILALLALLPAIVVSPTIVQAAGKPLAIALSPATVTVTEGQSASFTLTKSGGNGRAVSVKVTTSDGSWSGSVAAGTSFAIPTIDDSLVNGTRTIVVTAVASTGATAQATITELDNDVAPPPAATWTKCADENGICDIGTGNSAQVRYGSGATWTTPRTFTGSIACNNTTFGDPLFGTAKECDMTGVAVAPAPVPVPVPVPSPDPTTAWVLAPLVNDGYARCKTVGGCHAMGTTADYNPIIAQQGEVRQQAWNGCDGEIPVCRIIGAFWPIGHDPRKTLLASDWRLGVEGWQDEWEGVAPAP